MESLMIDNGSSACRAGPSGSQTPSVVFPLKHDDSSYIGKDEQSTRNVMDMDYPINRGIVTDFDNLEKMWWHIFSEELKMDAENYNVHLTAHKSKKDRKKMIELMFEKFNAPSVYISFQPLLSMYAAGFINGVSVCSGEGVTNIVPICEGYVDPKATVASNVAGSDLTEYLVTILNESDKEIVRNIKENLCYVDSVNFIPTIEPYELPDGKTIELGDEAARCSEVLFNPALINEEGCGIHECINKSITSSDINIRKMLYGNILLSGGNMLFPGMGERIYDELVQRAPAAGSIRVKTTDKGVNTVWLGGSILSGLSTFENMWITKQEYDSLGLQVLSKLYP